MELSYLAGRVRELSKKAYQNGFVTHSDFLSASELADAYRALAAEGYNAQSRRINGAELVVWGGWEDAERNMLCFLPDYLDAELFVMQEQAGGDVLACIRVVPLNAKFADALSHRDYLGALMNLGIERAKIGDILADEQEAYVFAAADIAPYICQELLRIRHTSVRCTLVAPSACTVRPKFELLSGSIASERLDAVLAMVYHLPRGKAQQLVENECVSLGGRLALSAGVNLKAGERVSVRGFGKFVYEGVESTTRKGRLFARVRKFV